jgi:hypothetical protein
LQAKELEDFCFKFSLNHMTAVTQTEAFSKLDEGTVKDFIMKVTGMLTSTVCISFWKLFPPVLLPEVLRSRSWSRKEPKLLAGAGAVFASSGSGSN